MTRLRIVMIGQKGLPATFGGVERHVEELGSRLAERGHDVIVYSRPSYATQDLTSYRGMLVRQLPTVGTKHLDAIVHSAICTVDALRRGADIVHYHAIGPGVPSVLPRLAPRTKVVQTIHGLDAERGKWGGPARTALRAATWLSARVPDATIVVARNLASHYDEVYGRRTTVIANGVIPKAPLPPDAISRRWGLTFGSYVLFVGRLVPEKAPDLLIRAWRDVPGDLRLVIAGGSSFTDDYVESLHRAAREDPRILLAGYVYGEELEELYSNSLAFALPSLLEGLPLTLLEAASYGRPVVASDIPPHAEVVRDDGPGHRLVHVGSEQGLADAVMEIVRDPAAATEGAEKLRAHVVETYRWDAIAEATERLYLSILGARRIRR